MGAPDDVVRQWVEAGVYDPSSETADERLALLEWLSARGITQAQIIAAHRRGELSSVAGDLLMRAEPQWTLRQIADQLGAPVESLVALRRAGGFPPVDPDTPAYTDSDVVVFRSFHEASAFFSHDELLHFSRVLGTSMRRIADAASEMFFVDVEAPLRAGDRKPIDVELELARKNLEAMELTSAAIATFEPMFRAQLAESIVSSRLARRNAVDLNTVPLAVGFVDLTGSTEIAEQIRPADLPHVVLEFEAKAYDLVADCGGRVVKMIGDEVMFTTVDAESACAIARGLLHTADGELATRPRGGVAFGNVIAHGGDLYGLTVNRASRMADIAIPNEVLVDAEVVSRAGSQQFQPAGRRTLKGFRDPLPLWSLTV
jgi:class 3 adenylate cyclase